MTIYLRLFVSSNGERMASKTKKIVIGKVIDYCLELKKNLKLGRIL